MSKLVAIYASLLLLVVTANAHAEPQQEGSSSSKVSLALQMQINLTLKRTPFTDAIDEITRLAGLNLVIDWPALREGRIAGDVPITLSLEAVAARTALDAVLDAARRPDARLTFVIRNEVVRVTTDAALSREIETRVYRCTDLLPTTLTDTERAELESAVTKLWRSHFSVFAPPWRLPRTNVGPREEAGVIAEELKSRLTARRMGQLAGAVHNVGVRSTWQEFGGLGSVTIVGDTLVVTQSLDHHIRIETLLAQLRNRLTPAQLPR